MERKMINEEDLQDVTGGSIMVSDDGKTCGRNCTNQYKVLNLSAMSKYVNEHKGNMSEKMMLNEMVKLGYIANL